MYLGKVTVQQLFNENKLTIVYLQDYNYIIMEEGLVFKR